MFDWGDFVLSACLGGIWMQLVLMLIELKRIRNEITKR